MKHPVLSAAGIGTPNVSANYFYVADLFMGFKLHYYVSKCISCCACVCLYICL